MPHSNRVAELLQCGIAAAKDGRAQEALQALLRVTELDGRNEQAWLWLSGLVDSPDERRACLENVLAINPNNAHAQAGLRWLNGRSSSPPAPAPQNRCPRCETSVPSSVASCPHCQQVLIVACPECEQDVGVQDISCPNCGCFLGDFGQGARYHLALAWAYLGQQKHELAQEAITHAQAEAGGDLEVLEEVAALYQDIGRMDLVTAAYEHAVEHAPDNVELCIRLGELYREHARLTDARLMYEQAVERGGGTPEVFAQLVQLYANVGVGRPERSGAGDNRHPRQTTTPLLERAIGLIHVGDRKNSYRFLAQALKADPQNARAWLWLATVVHQDDLRQKCLQEALKHDPRNKVAKQTLANLQRSKLGESIAQCEGKVPIVPLVGLVVFILIIIAGLVLYSLGLLPAIMVIVVIVLGVLFALVAIHELIDALGQRTVAIYEQGIAYNTASNTRVVYWQDITTVWQRFWRSPFGLNISYALEVKGEKKQMRFSNSHFEDMETLGEAIRRHVTRCLLPRYAKTLEEGGRAQFGKLALDRRGIIRGSKTLPWHRIQQVDVQKGMVIIRQEGQWFAWARIPAHQVANLSVFLTLTDHIVGRQNGS